MKIQILISQVFLGSVLTVNAQTLYLPNGTGGIGNNTSNSNIGIGISTPDAPFTVYGVTHIYPNMKPIGDVRQFSIKYTLSNPSFLNNVYPIVLGTGGGNQPLILDAARIGIGTLNPDSKLTINGDFKVVNGNNELSYNGLADIIFRYKDRGTGGRAIVHDVNNTLVLNYDYDFTGGTRIGSNLSVNGVFELDKIRSIYGGFRLVEDNIDDYNVLFQMGRGGANGGFRFYSNCKHWDNGGDWGTGQQRHLMSILGNGRVGIGTTNPQYTLDVIGTIRAREIKVDLNGADFVFEKDYKLMPLNELEKFVKEQKHLPEIVSAKEMEKNGTELGDLNSKLLQKMEEMTLYIIEQNKKIEALQEKIEKLEAASK